MDVKEIIDTKEEAEEEDHKDEVEEDTKVVAEVAEDTKVVAEVAEDTKDKEARIGGRTMRTEAVAVVVRVVPVDTVVMLIETIATVAGIIIGEMMDTVAETGSMTTAEMMVGKHL